MDRAAPSTITTFLRAISRFALPVALVIFATPFVILLFYSLPATDDFCKATLSFNCVPQSGVIRITWMYYTQWSPRWLTTLLQSFVMSHVDLVAAYGWLLLSVIVSNLAALWYFFRTFFRLSRTTSLLVAATFYAAWVVTLPHPSEELFWLTGAMEYFLSLTTLLILVSLLLKARLAVWYYVAVAMLSVAVPAQHEIAGTFLCVALLAGAVIMRLRQAPTIQWWLSLGVAALSQAFVMLSPGNAFRAAQEHRHIWDLSHMPKWLAHSFYHGLTWLAHPSFLLAAGCIILLVQRDRETHAPTEQTANWLPLAVLAGMLFVLGEFFLVEMAGGHWVPERVVVWFEFVFWLLFVCVILTGAPEVFQARFSLTTRVGVLVLFAIALLGSANYRAAIEDLSGPAQAWRRLDSSRLKQRGGGALEFEAPARYPNFAMNPTLTTDAGCWVNRCFAIYLHAQSVVVKNSTEECPH